MLTYSQWRPDGGYDYFETRQTAPLGNDLPTPRMSIANGIGVPSVEAGRAMPPGAVRVGSGKLPIGVIAPMGRSRVEGIDYSGGIDWMAFAAGAVFTGAAWFMWGRIKR